MKDPERFARAIARVYTGKVVKVYLHSGACHEGEMVGADAKYVRLMVVDPAALAGESMMPVPTRQVLGLSCPDLAKQP